MQGPATSTTRLLAPLLVAWLGLVVLTLFSLGLGEWFATAAWTPVLVAAVIWTKAWLVARYFLEATECHVFIRRLIWTFIAFAPVALLLTDRFGRQFAAFVQL